MKNHILILGSIGFIGSNLSKLINNYTTFSPSIDDCNLLDYNSTKKYLSNFIDKNVKIINLAAIVAGVIYNKTHNVEMLYKNSIMNLNLALAIKELKLKCYLLNVSSVCAYKPCETFLEDNFFNGEPFSSNYGYGTAKRLALSSLKALELDCSELLRYSVLIPSNMYGPYDNFKSETSHVIPSLIKKFNDYNTNKIDIHGNCTNVRSFLFAEDFCNIIKLFIDKEIEGVFNVSSPDSISIYNLANKIQKITNSNKEINFCFNGEVEKRKVDISKLLNIIGDFKFTNLEDGLIKTNKYYLENATGI